MCKFSTLLQRDIHLFIKSFIPEKVEKYTDTVSYGTPFKFQFYTNKTNMSLIHITWAFIIIITVKICYRQSYDSTRNQQSFCFTVYNKG
jgi:hypothetical protein